MFEGTLVESRGLVASPTVRWTTAGSIVLQSAVALTLVILPLLRPEAIPFLHEAPQLIAPPAPRPPMQPVHVRMVEHAAASTPALPVETLPASAPTLHLPSLHPTNSDTVPAIDTGVRMTGTGSGAVIPGLGDPAGSSNIRVTRAAPAGPLQVSSGVTSGMLLTPITPVYPNIAKATRTQGAVVMEAVISRTGTIESLHVVSGPDMLRTAALQAVEHARYKPFLLNNQPVEVQTIITVNFRLDQ